MKIKSFNAFAATLAILSLLAGASALAGTITVNNLPVNQTDFATQLDPAKHYLCTFQFGNGPSVGNINGVPFTHCVLLGNTIGSTGTNWVDQNFAGGNVTVSVPTAVNLLRNTSSATQGNLVTNACGQTFVLLEGPIYNAGAGANVPLEAQFGTLTPGDSYSLRIYYRYWGNSLNATNRANYVAFFGEGSWQSYQTNPLDEDVGGAHWVEYDFTAAGTTVTCALTNAPNTSGGYNNAMIYAATLEDTSAGYTYAPFFTDQPYESQVGVPGVSPSILSAQTIGPSAQPTSSYQWFVSTNDSYSGGTMLTDGNGYLGSATANLTVTNNIGNGYWYYLVANNNYGYTTSSIAQILPGTGASVNVSTLYQTPASPSWRDNYNGASGCEFTIGSSNVVVSHLGYFSTNYISGLNMGHYVALYSGTLSSPKTIVQVTVPQGLAADYYTNEFYWMPLDPPVLLSSNTTYFVASLPGTVADSGYDGDWWGDSFSATFNSAFLGSTTNTSQKPMTIYGPGGGVWPPTGFSAFGGNTTYCQEGLANLPVDKARVGVTPTNEAVAAGATITVQGFATGQTPINYQWWQGGSPLSGQTNQTLTIPNALSGNSGTYYLTASNALGGEQSANVTITVADNQVGIQQGLTNETVFAHYLASFSMVATGTPPISVQWSSNSVVIPSAGTNDLASPAVSSTFSEYPSYPANNGDVYIAQASNDLLSVPYTGQSTSTLTVLPNFAYPQEILYTAPTNLFVNSVGGGVQNAVGGVITVGNNPVLVTHLGYPATGLILEGKAALAENHNLTVYLWNNGSPQLLGYTTVTAGTPTNSEVNGYFWATLNPPLLLSNKTQYCISAQTYENDPDDWGGDYAITNLNPYFASFVSAEYANNVTWPTPPTSGGYGSQIYSAITLASLTNFLLAEVSPAGNATVPASSSFTLTAYGAGQAPLYYPQWYLNGAALANQTNTTLTISPLNTASSGNFYVVLSNYDTSVTVTSAVTTLTVPPLTALSAGVPIWNQTSNIIVTFSGPLDPATSQNALNYLLNNGATVSSATLVATNEVALTTTPLSGSYTLTVQNVMDPYGDTVSSSPTNVVVGAYPANLALWVRANTGVTADGSGNVSQWNDMTANGNDLFTISAIDPILTTNNSGDPVIRFSGTNQTQMAASTSASLGITGDMSIITVINFATLAGGTNGDIVSKTGSGGQANIPAPYDYYVGSTANLFRGNGGSGGNGTSYGSFGAANGPSVGTPHILAVSETGDTVSHFLDGQAAGTGLLSNNYQETNNLDVGNDFTVGARLDGHNVLTGDISELIMAGSAISSYDVSQLTSYLETEHNIVTVKTNPTNILFSVSSGNLTLSWPSDHTGWQLQAQTNSVAVGLSTNWVNVNGSSGTNAVVVPLNLTNGTVFYRLVYP